MKRDPETIRDLLLALETEASSNNFSTKDLPKLDQVSAEIVLAHLNLLIGAGYIERAKDSYGKSPRFDKFSISWAGYDFLESIRDPEIWNQTKVAASKVGGLTIELLGDVAKGFVKTKLKTHTGVEI